MELLQEGFKLMAVGMGVVFSFLALMVIVISSAAKILAPYAGILDKPDDKPQRKKPVKKATTDTGNDAAMAAAAVAAVHMHRNKK